MPKTLLYVEDNTANVMLMEDIMEQRPQIHMLSACDGAQGIAFAREHKPDLILMDIKLPDISGIDAMSILRADSATRHIPAIAVSANAMRTEVMAGINAGFIRYITKPVKVVELLAVLDEMLVRKSL